jgi:serine protease Do
VTLRSLEAELVGAVDRLRPSVVRIRRLERVRTWEGPRSVEAAGSGIVVDEQGLIVTNDHVVHGASELIAQIDGAQEVPASVVGEDPATDLALVRADARGLRPAELADSEKVRVGQFALAIGSSLGLPGGPTVSVGVVSAMGRPMPGTDYVLEGLLQTDAAINPGNSGGPLANLEGAVIGANAAMIPYAQGVGFAIPSNTIRMIVDQLRETGRVTRPWLGISAVTLEPGMARQFGIDRPSGVLIADVQPEGAAAHAGLRRGDVLVRVGPYETPRMRELLGALGRLPIGGAVDVEFERDRHVQRGVVRIMESPPSLPP